MEEPLISVIVPIYKVEKYINQCVDSLLYQTYKNVEIILVDDGSPDKCPKICDEYEQQDKRVKVIHENNCGLSVARNVGIDHSSGSYLWFIDSDDWLIVTTAFHIVADMIESENADVLFFSYKKFFDKSGHYSRSMFSHVPEGADIRECIRTNAYKACAWNKVVRRSLVVEHNLCFPVGRTCEDLGWCADLLAYANKLVLCKNDLMAYRQRAGSITSNIDSQRITNAFNLIKETIDKYDIGTVMKKGNELIGNYLAYEFSWLIGEAYPFWNDYFGEIRKLEFLLNYDLCYKVAKVRKLKQLIGLKRTAFVLNQFLKMKKYKN